MSTRIVAQEIQEIVALLNGGLSAREEPFSADDVSHFIVGRDDGGTGNPIVLDINISSDQCAVVVAIENQGTSGAGQPISWETGGQDLTEVNLAQSTAGADVFYVFGPGIARFTFPGIPSAPGVVIFLRAAGYLLPHRALRRLARMSTRNL